MTVVRGKEHVFVGMNFEFSNENTVIIHTKEYIKESIESFTETGDSVKGHANTPAKHDLFTVGMESPLLDEEKYTIFHHIVSKLLYVSKRARLDIDLYISFLCTRFSKSTEQDWEKLRRLLTYLQNTIDMVRIIGYESIDTILTCTDASYATHNDMRGHTGGTVSLGRGVVHSKSVQCNYRLF